MAGTIFSDLLGTLQSTFRIASAMWKNASSILEAKLKDDSAYTGIGASQVVLHGGTSGTTTLSPAAEATGSYVLPAADGSSGYCWATDGAGNLYWKNTASASNTQLTQQEEVVFGSSSPISIFTPPANCLIEQIVVKVTEAFNATGSPSLSVGVAGSTTRYMAATENELGTEATFITRPVYEEDASPEEVIITFSPGSAGSAGRAIVDVTYSNPS